ncbi:hypothetical protein TrCOL_g9746 [Triparma columacea]|uniref:RING-type domain-containing protein n=1 Tax=Triparma columacea TaxID=722753 RepID=A0A9W7FX19_9STRA|nr:hypothetical protein TrCOL_g9746 [Triparma columacea]
MGRDIVGYFVTAVNILTGGGPWVSSTDEASGVVGGSGGRPGGSGPLGLGNVGLGEARGLEVLQVALRSIMVAAFCSGLVRSAEPLTITTGYGEAGRRTKGERRVMRFVAAAVAGEIIVEGGKRGFRWAVRRLGERRWRRGEGGGEEEVETNTDGTPRDSGTTGTGGSSSSGRFACPICRCSANNLSFLKGCGHTGCWGCMVEGIGRTGRCPVCRAEGGERDVRLVEGYR